MDVCVRRVLRAKFESGLFENPYPAEHIDVTAIAGEGAELSRRLARESVVLVKNDGLLPVAPSSGLTVAVVGPHADAVTLQFPVYSYPAYRELLAVPARGQAGNAVGVAPAKADWLSGVVDPVGRPPSSTTATVPVRCARRSRSSRKASRSLVPRHRPPLAGSGKIQKYRLREGFVSSSSVVKPGSSHVALTSSSNATLIKSAGLSFACAALRIASATTAGTSASFGKYPSRW